MGTMGTKSKSLVWAVMLSVLGLGDFAAADTSYHVTSAADDGAGSLRNALFKGATKIVIPPQVGTIKINSPLVYDGRAPLTIVGSGQTISGEGTGVNLLEVTHGADLTISDLSFADSGGYSVNKQGGGNGLLVQVPLNRTGVVSVNLARVNVTGVGDHGIHILDCDRVDCGAGTGGGGKGSRASVSVTLDEVFVRNVGNGHFDADGIRVDERGDGDVIFNATNSSFIGVGADGIELDEGDGGDVKVTADNLMLLGNGGYCSPIDPITPPYEDDGCVEDDDGKPALDLDDGFDIDEAGPGSITGRISNSLLSFNLDEGLDFDEEDAGGFNISLRDIYTFQNEDEGLKISEEGRGGVKADLRAVYAIRNSDDGIQIEEEDGGNLEVTFDGVTTQGNSKEGAKVEQAGAGRGSLAVKRSQIDKLSTDGVRSSP